MKTTNIFEVDVDGLRQLQEGKPKWFIIRELLQNAIDENITTCDIHLDWQRGKAFIQVNDDSPTGFRDLSDAYTLFKDTYKRSDVKKRGRFNFGEKQVLCLCDSATILTTTGCVEFDIKKGVKTLTKNKTPKGSMVFVTVKMTHEEFVECCKYCDSILVPDNIKVDIIVGNMGAGIEKVDGHDWMGTVAKGTWKTLSYQKPHKIFTTKLPTELKEGDRMRNVTRETAVHIHNKNGSAYIYEMGIPICEIECDYSIDIQQKVPLSNDRDKVDGKYLKVLYGEILNHTHEEITEEQSSRIWVRTGTTSDRVTKETVQDVITKRFGENALIANPLDPRSMDEAISNGHNVIYGREMDKDEWTKVKGFDLLETTSQKYKVGITESKKVNPSDDQKKIAEFAKKISKEFLHFDLSVEFISSSDASTVADFGGNNLRFNVPKITKSMWTPSEDGYIKQTMLDLLIHEIGHKAGWHYEHAYHECITKLGSQLTIKALTEPNWFIL
jgi:hypothetical protein